jgi:hypothetical protein
MLARNQSQVRHQLNRRTETHKRTDLRGNGDGRNERHTAQGLKYLNDGCLRTDCSLIEERFFNAPHSLLNLFKGMKHFGKRDLHRVMFKRKLGEPDAILFCPSTFNGNRRMNLVTKQEFEYALTSTVRIFLCSLASADELTQRFVFPSRYIDWCQLTCPEKPSKLFGVSTIVLDMIPWSFRHQ